MPRKNTAEEGYEEYNGYEGYEEYDGYEGYEEYDRHEETKSTDANHNNNIKALLIEYRKQLIETSDLIKEKNELVPQKIQDAITYISNQIGHWAGQQH